MLFIITLLILGLIILIVGAETLVKGASSISKKLHVPPIVIGLTIVAFGTSAPELIVNIFSALKGSPDLALGNIIGSNIANILLILGVSALSAELTVKKNTTWKEIPLAFLSVAIVLFMANDRILNNEAFNFLSRTDGLILLSFFIIFLYYTFNLFLNRDHSANIIKKETEVKVYSLTDSILMAIGGLLLLFFGGQLFVEQATNIAKIAGISEMLIGLTVAAVGTSLPELVTSVVAVRKGHADIAVGNVVGSNIFNVLWILGITSIIKPIPVSENANVDIIVCLAATSLLFSIVFIGKKYTMERWQGGLFIFAYVAYMFYVFYRG